LSGSALPELLDVVGEAEYIGQAGVSEWVLAAGEQEYSALPGRLGRFAGDVEIALRDEHLVGGR